MERTELYSAAHPRNIRDIGVSVNPYLAARGGRAEIKTLITWLFIVAILRVGIFIWVYGTGTFDKLDYLPLSLPGIIAVLCFVDKRCVEKASGNTKKAQPIGKTRTGVAYAVGIASVGTLLLGIGTFILAWLGMFGGDPDWVIQGAAGDLVDKHGILGAYGRAIDILLLAFCLGLVTRRAFREVEY